MPYCSKCGVEVNEGIEECPLCNLPIQYFPEDTEKKIRKKVYPERTDQQVNGRSYPDEEIEQPGKRTLTKKEKKFKIWEIIGVSLLIPFLIVTFTDLIISTSITWAKFPMITLLLVWLLCTFPLVFTKRPVVIIIGITFSLFGFLVLVDYFSNWKIDWIQLALPIIALVLFLAVAVVVPSTYVKQKGMNIAAFILFAIGLLNLGLDLIIMSTIHGKITVTWSLFVLVPTFIIGGFLMYMHYRFTKDTDFKTKIKAKFQM